MTPPPLRLFDRLKMACAEEWRAYVTHPFVQRLGEGRLPQSCFRRYLGQDYLFLIQIARACGLAVYKSAEVEDIRRGAEALAAMLDETRLHIAFCARWGVSEADLAQAGEAPATLAYSRYVLDCGASGDLLDLEVAMSPCVIGYAEIGAALQAAGVAPANPYQEWVDTYAGEAYQALAAAQVDKLDRLLAARGGMGRERALIGIFRTATMLETAFWEAGLETAG